MTVMCQASKERKGEKRREKEREEEEREEQEKRKKRGMEEEKRGEKDRKGNRKTGSSPRITLATPTACSDRRKSISAASASFGLVENALHRFSIQTTASDELTTRAAREDMILSSGSIKQPMEARNPATVGETPNSHRSSIGTLLGY